MGWSLPIRRISSRDSGQIGGPAAGGYPTVGALPSHQLLVPRSERLRADHEHRPSNSGSAQLIADTNGRRDGAAASLFPHPAVGPLSPVLGLFPLRETATRRGGLALREELGDDESRLTRSTRAPRRLGGVLGRRGRA